MTDQLAALDAMLDKAVAEIHALQRKGLDASIWAFETTAERDGFLYVGQTHPEGQGFGTFVRPSDNYASTHNSWRSVPYSATRQILRAAIGRQPILPIPR